MSLSGLVMHRMGRLSAGAPAPGQELRLAGAVTNVRRRLQRIGDAWEGEPAT
jgi:hypothetical protein